MSLKEIPRAHVNLAAGARYSAAGMNSGAGR